MAIFTGDYPEILEAVKKLKQERQRGEISPLEASSNKDKNTKESITRKSQDEAKKEFINPSIDKSLLPYPLGEYFEDVGLRLELPFELVATTGFAFLCNLISDKLCIIPTKDIKYRIIPNLWGCIISQKGTRKTPLFKAFTDMIYKKHFRYIEIYEEEKAKYEAKIKTLNAKTKALARAEAEGDTEKR